MRRADLLKRLTDEARRAGVEFVHVREGRHSIYRYDGRIVPIPRHTEINELTARGILRDCGLR